MSGLLCSGDKVLLDHSGAAPGMVGKVEAVWNAGDPDDRLTYVSVLVRIVVPESRIAQVYNGGVWEART